MSNVPPGPNLRGAIDLSALVQRAERPAPAPAAPAAEGGEAATSAAPVSSPFVVRSDDASFPQLIELSNTVPVLVEFLATGMEPALAEAVASYNGRILLAVVDAQANPQLAGAFQLREIPATAAVIAGRPMSLFVGDLPADQLRQLLDELLQVAAQNGVSGQLPADPGAAAATDSGAPAEPEEPPLPPLHQEAYDAISVGDFGRAIDAYRRAIKENPRDALATAGLAQVSLLQRLEGAEAGTIRAAAAAAPASVAAQLAVADLDVSGGHLEDAFVRLLELFPTLDAEGKAAVRARLLEYFEIAGPDDERVAPARRQLASLLY